MGKFHQTNVGNARLIALQDSWASLPPSMFFATYDETAWAPYRDLLDADGNMTLNIGAWLIISDGRTILVDTGIGGRPTRMPLKEPPAIPAILEETGVRPADIDLVVFTHLHFDHTGWNTIDRDGSPALTFPNARHVVQRREWEYWTRSGDERAAARYDDVLAPIEAAGKLDLVEGEHAITPEVVTVPTPGHTPGHVSFVIQSGSERAYVLGDVAHQPVQLAEPTWCPNADIDKDQSTATRSRIWDRIEEEGALIASGHFPFPGLGRITRQDGKRRFAPLA
ncbi:MAG: MBL fold metallo-hydrolase [Dehalococcoidia bacterium]